MTFEDVPLFEVPGGDGAQPKEPPRQRRLGPIVDPTLWPDSGAIARFWSNVVQGPGASCWLWVGPISTPDGYGRFSWQINGRRRTLSAHRFALMIALGREIPDGFIAEHCCCEPLCVRFGSFHVRQATQAENLDWAVHRGRHFGSVVGSGSQGRAARSQLVRAAVRNGWNEDALRAARDFTILDEGQARLW